MNVEPVTETFSRLVEPVERVSAFVGVVRRDRSSPHHRVFAKIEFNPARVVDPSGHSDGCGEVHGALEAAVKAAECVVVGSGDGKPDSCRVKRLDVARDFQGVASPSGLIRGLVPVARKWARRNVVHSDPLRNGAQTLTIGSDAGAVRF